MPVSQQHSPTLRDCVYGQAVGDALGVPYEFRARCTFECTGMAGHGSHNQPAGTWSDDTSMSLASCDSIRATGRIDVRDMRERFVRWYREGAYTVSGLFDIGGTTADALSSGRGRTGERDNGNGSLMRILPLAFTDATDDEVRAVSAITHAHATSCEACVRMVHVARRLIAGEGPRDVAGSLVGVPASQIRSGGFVLDTERAALWCLANTSSYAECVLAAVNLGDDTDTTAAVAGRGRAGRRGGGRHGLRGADVRHRAAGGAEHEGGLLALWPERVRGRREAGAHPVRQGRLHGVQEGHVNRGHDPGVRPRTAHRGAGQGVPPGAASLG
ncbi:ADP-ribosylglycohydrolase family protein [Olsenella sp. kh2p3]|uniref:ADP-ribosylglycohydrolase family protein n=1 Tax=Olsenella sp. kh2p3 TaxID=1797112 RepID=UPI0009316007|nr:ADP-ribosylglycohydrolase family protein [Olsenella sp. kh2p3]